MATEVALADDIAVEADSGGHTDNRPIHVILPLIIELRDAIQRELPHLTQRVRVGVGGGVGVGVGVCVGPGVEVAVGVKVAVAVAVGPAAATIQGLTVQPATWTVTEVV